MKSKRVLISKLKPIYTTFLHSIDCSGYKVRIKSYKDPLAVEQKNYVTKIVNIYIAYGSNAWPKKILITISNQKIVWCN